MLLETGLVTTPIRIRLSRRKGWRLPEAAVSVARPGKWGNPFVVGKDGNRLQCVTMFAILADGFIDLGGRLSVDDQLTIYRRIRRSLGDLKGRDLACWCPEGAHCHADILLFLANGDRPFPLAGLAVDLPRMRIGMGASQFERLSRASKRREREEAAVVEAEA